MIRLATVFSGIGAIEHALDRMGLDHKIVFACDNGDIDILSKKIDEDLVIMKNEISLLNDVIKNIADGDKKEEKELNKKLKDCDKRLDNLVQMIANCNFNAEENGINISQFVEQNIITDKKISKSKIKKYNDLLIDFNNASDENQKYKLIQISLLLIKDYKSKKIEFIDKLDKIAIQYNFKKIENKMKENCEFLSMLHERINTYKIQNELSKINDYGKKKFYVDNLYKGKDTQNQVMKSYLANYNIGKDKFHWNVSFLDGKQYENMVDLFVGGSPCQSFSLVGKQRGLEDTRGTLFYEYARLISEIKPKVFIYENVKAVLSNDNGKTWETMQKVFTDLDYTWDFKVLNAKDYGIPQNRERLYVVGFRNDLKLEKNFTFPKPIELDKTMRSFLVDNVYGRYYLPKKGVEFVTDSENINKRYTQIDGDIALCQKKNQQFNWHGDFVFEEENVNKEKTMQELDKYFLSDKVEKYVMSAGTKGFYSKPEVDLDVARPLLTTMHKMHRAGVDNYVTTEGRLRKLTPRECLRLMGFSDDFQIVVSDTAMYQQAGNSIVVNVLMSIMEEILKCYNLEEDN